MKIIIGNDHAGVSLKQAIAAHLKEQNISVENIGTDETGSVDYPDYGKAVGEKIATGEADLGIVICGTGVGISISANKVKGVRCACVSEPFSAKMARSHNNCNVLAIGARVLGEDLALMIVDTFISEPFSGGERHMRRVDKIMAIEE